MHYSAPKCQECNTFGASGGTSGAAELRPLAVTAHDTLEWFKAQPKERQDKFNLNLERDVAALKAWHGKG